MYLIHPEEQFSKIELLILVKLILIKRIAPPSSDINNFSK